MDWTTIIATAITATATVLVAVVNNNIKNLRKSSDMHFMRNEIMQLIVQDEVAEMKGKQPVNYKTVCELYDQYHKVGNSYITETVEEYKKWAKSRCKAAKK